MTVQAPTQYSKSQPFPACLTENRLLNNEGSAKETRHFVVDIAGSGLSYSCGDSLGVYPQNRDEDVADVLKALGCEGTEEVTLGDDESSTLRLALTSRTALNEPAKGLLELLAESATDPDEQTKLAELLDRKNGKATREWLSERHLIDLLEAFPSAQPSPQAVVDVLKKLQPRLYSIASSPTQYPEEVHLTIATVRYETHGRDRVGVCSTYLSDRVPLNNPIVPVYVAESHFGLPEDPTTDLIMIGPGTGVAPFRSFLQDRVASGAPGRNWLFFGDQHEASDFLYADEMRNWLADGTLSHLSLAWSRDQDFKIYVQDKMLEAGAELFRWLEGGAMFYVCGDAKRMAGDVDTALHQIIEKHGQMDAKAAKKYVQALKKEKRYQRDVY